MKKRIAKTLRCARKRSGLTQETAATKSGYSSRQIQRIEREGTDSINTLLVLAKTYHVHLAELLFPPGQCRAGAIKALTRKR